MYLPPQLDIPYINLKYYNVKLEIVRQLPENQARRFRALLLEERKDNRLLVGMADPTDLFAFDEIGRVLKRDIDIAVVTEGRSRLPAHRRDQRPGAGTVRGTG